MKIAILGAGAIGGFLGAKLALAGNDVSAVARGATAEALKRHGFRLAMNGETVSAPVRVADPAALGPQDLVIVAVKAPALAAAASSVAPLLGPETIVLPAMNGVPWWFFSGLGGPYDGLTLASADPEGAIAAAIPTRQVIGCVVHATCSVPEPGLVKHGFGRRLIIGEPEGGASARLQNLAALLTQAGFETETSPRIQADIWYKLWGNMTMNPISALTGATCDLILDDPLLNAYCLAIMAEAAAIGAKIGCPIAQSGADRNAVTRKLGAFKTSMLQDVEAGRPLEIDALLGTAHEIGMAVGLPTPHIDSLLGLIRLAARQKGLTA